MNLPVSDIEIRLAENGGDSTPDDCAFQVNDVAALAGRNRDLLDMVRRHERAHVSQCEHWGPAFIPAYLVAAAWSFVQGRGAYEGNYFERQARNAE